MVQACVDDAKMPTAECYICYTDYCIGDEYYSYDCCHRAFHKSCADQWLLLSRDCHMCKQAVSIKTAVETHTSAEFTQTLSTNQTLETNLADQLTNFKAIQRTNLSENTQNTAE